MATAKLIESSKFVLINMISGDCWIRFAFGLTKEYIGGELLQFPNLEKVSIQGVDDLASSYTLTNWKSGIVSGAHYAFRTLQIPRQHLLVSEFSGRLRSTDMDALANASALAIARLAGKDFTGLSAEQWTVTATVSDQRLATSEPAL